MWCVDDEVDCCAISQRIHHQTVKQTDPRSQKERTFRMAKQNLIDTLFDEFGRYKYWSIRALRERLMQPEAWLKECLLEVAEQEQDGPYKSELIRSSSPG